MKTNTKTVQVKTRKKYLIFGIIALVILILGFGGWKMYDNLQPKSYPLGDKLEYIGKEDFGCTIGFCDHEADSVYYYATNMSTQEVESYFRNATVEFPIDREISNSRIWLKTKSGDSFIIRYYDDKNETIKKNGLSPKNANMVISLLQSEYDSAKKSL